MIILLSSWHYCFPAGSIQIASGLEQDRTSSDERSGKVKKRKEKKVKDFVGAFGGEVLSAA